VVEPIGGKYKASSLFELFSSELQLKSENIAIKSKDVFFIADIFETFSFRQ